MECGSAPLAQDHIFQEDTKDQFVGEQDCVSKLRGEMIPKLDKLPLYSPDTLTPHPYSDWCNQSLPSDLV